MNQLKHRSSLSNERYCWKGEKESASHFFRRETFFPSRKIIQVRLQLISQPITGCILCRVNPRDHGGEGGWGHFKELTKVGEESPQYDETIFTKLNKNEICTAPHVRFKHIDDELY